MKTRKLSKAQVEAAPYEIWNAFVNLLWMEHYEDLSPEQRAAQLVIKYDGEVQNGGHLQYFENGRGQYLDETLMALGTLRAQEHQRILREAVLIWRGRSRYRFQSVDEYCERALEGEFDDLDRRFYSCHPPLNEYLEQHLNANLPTYVSIE